jgi:hypothetical protein
VQAREYPGSTHLPVEAGGLACPGELSHVRDATDAGSAWLATCGHAGCGTPAVADAAKTPGRPERSRSERDDLLMIDLDELNDQIRELAGDQVAVGRRTGVRVIGGLIGEVLDE